MEEVRQTIPDLVAIRESRGISLEEIGRATNINLYYLQAIENGDVQKLPEGIYTTSYIRQYARAIDFNEDDLIGMLTLPAGTGSPVVEQPQATTLAGFLMRFIALVTHARQLVRTGRVQTG